MQLGSQIAILTGGNEQLIPETGTGLTITMTYEPEWFDELSLRTATHHYSIDNTITAYDAQTVLDSCYLEGIVAFCDFIDHSGNGAISRFQNTLFNIGTINTSGYDFGMTYRNEWKSFGEVVFSFDATVLSSFEEISRDALGVEIQHRELVGRSTADRGKPELKYTTSVDWQVCRPYA